MRITNKHLENAINELNKATGNPVKLYEKTETGYKANIGCYHLAGAYGGYQLQQIVNNGGGVHDVFSVGYVSKRELYNLICAMVQGVHAKAA
jgi:hypothetical protein